MVEDKMEVFETELALCRIPDGFGFVIQWAWVSSTDAPNRIHVTVWRVTEAEREDADGRMVGGFDLNSRTNSPIFLMYMRYCGKNYSRLCEGLSLSEVEDLIQVADMIKYVTRKAARLIDPNREKIQILEDEELKYISSVPFETTITPA